MARLLLKTGKGEPQVFDLKLGVNRVGRHPESDLFLDHPNVSTHHANIILSADSIVLEDCNSTNGTFVNGSPVKQKTLQAGEVIHFGDVEVLVESTDVAIAIPGREIPIAPPPDASSSTPSQSTVAVPTLNAPHHSHHHISPQMGLPQPGQTHHEVIHGKAKKKRSVLSALKETVVIPLLKARRPPKDD